MEFHFCDPCNKSFNGARPYRDHMASENHKKKISQDQASSAARSTPGSSSFIADPFIEIRGNDFWCILCKIELNSKLQATNHVFGNKHRKLKPSSQENMSSQVPKLNLSDVQGISFGISSSLADPFIEIRGKDFWCSLCKVELNSKEQATNHVLGKKHKKLKPSSQEDVSTEIPKTNLPNINLTNSPENSLEDFKFSFRGIYIDNVLDGVKVFGVDDPIVF